MDYDAARTYLLAMPEAVEDFPFGIETAVFKVRDRMFATLGFINGMASMNLKCNPDEALALRDIFPAVRPGYHMNKRHWNTLTLGGRLPNALIAELIRHSYDLVVTSLPKKLRAEITQ